MATITDLYSLPEKVPELACYGGLAKNLSAAFAIYHTIPLSPDDRADVLTAMVPDPAADAAKFSVPLCDFSGLLNGNAAVAGYHAVLAQQYVPDSDWPELHPTSIIIVDDANWRSEGVLLVSLNVDGEGSTGAFPAPADRAVLILFNIRIGISTWEEECHSASLSQSLRSELPVSYGDGSRTLTWKGCNGETDPCFALCGPPKKCDFRGLPQDGFTNLLALLARINGRDAWERGLAYCPCLLAPWNDFTEGEEVEDTLERVAKLQVDEREKYEPDLVFHPWLFVWAEGDYENEGVLLCKFDVVDGTPTALMSKRVPVEEAVVELLKTAQGE